MRGTGEGLQTKQEKGKREKNGGWEKEERKGKREKWSWREIQRPSGRWQKLQSRRANLTAIRSKEARSEKKVCVCSLRRRRPRTDRLVIQTARTRTNKSGSGGESREGLLHFCLTSYTRKESKVSSLYQVTAGENPIKMLIKTLCAGTLLNV